MSDKGSGSAKEAVTSGTVDGPSVTVLPPEAGHHIHDIPGLDVSPIKSIQISLLR